MFYNNLFGPQFNSAHTLTGACSNLPDSVLPYLHDMASAYSHGRLSKIFWPLEIIQVCRLTCSLSSKFEMVPLTIISTLYISYEVSDSDKF